eukprot:TRINITY_DN22147_c0_g1_i1.p1 TRINITY_DN22147_c0_g1~~TRINITY_DN22147_c0_g1_i1.p1  ORF type:complete len:509 (+),score=196.45 TRINITY_DN22147_c0_g1_i1:55-1581(+)
MAVPRRVVVAGAGVAGCSTAMHLARRGAQVTLVDPRPPMTATSQYSSESYRNFFLDAEVVPLMRRSIAIMEAQCEKHGINMTRRGYLFLTGTEEGAASLTGLAERASALGAGDVRYHDTAATYQRNSTSWTDYDRTLDGFDVVRDPGVIRELYPFLTPKATAMVHARKCGWLDAQRLGRSFFDDAKADGAAFVQGAIQQVSTAADGAVDAVTVTDAAGAATEVPCDAFVNCGGAWLNHINELAGAPRLPTETQIVSKVVLHDTEGVIPQAESPFVVWRDNITLDWSEDMQEALVEMDDVKDGGIMNTASWLGEQQGGQHFRPLGNERVLFLWEHIHGHIRVGDDPEFPVAQLNDFYPEISLEAMKALVPALDVYTGALGKHNTTMDAGYYCMNTEDARPVISQHGPPNCFVVGTLSGWGIMSSAVCGELCAQHVLKEDLPQYAGAFTWPRERPLEGPAIDLLDPPLLQDECLSAAPTAARKTVLRQRATATQLQRFLQYAALKPKGRI